MKTIQTDSGQIKVEDLLNSIAQLKIADLEGFAKQVTNILKKKKAPILKKQEQDLIDRIKNGGPSKTFLKRQRILLEKSVKGLITETEHQEALAMIPIASKWDLERIKLMLQLAELRNTTLEEVRISLKINPPEDVYA